MAGGARSCGCTERFGGQGFTRRTAWPLAQVAISSLESNLLKWSAKDYLLRAGICHLAGGEAGIALAAVERYKSLDAGFEGTREGTFLEAVTRAFESADADAFTDLVREYDEISRLDPQKTSLLLDVKNKIKAQINDLT